MSTEKAPLRSYRTRLRSTEIFADEGCFLWVREPGTQAPEPFPSVPRRLAASLEDIRTEDGSRWVLGQERGPGRTYRLHGDRSLAGRLVGPRNQDAKNPVPAMREVGVLLGRLHALPLEGEGSGPTGAPASLARLRGWFEETPLDERLRDAREGLRARLGERDWDRLRTWTDEVEQARGKVVSHGWLGTGRCIPHPDADSVEIITGEDIGLAPPAFDLGLLVGEILEMRRFLPAPEQTWELVLDELLKGYGQSLDVPVLRCAALGILLHLHDFCAHTDGPLEGEVLPRADLVGVLLERAA